MTKHSVFDKHIDQYEKWFDDNNYVFQSELKAIQQLLPSEGKGVEIGVGSGIFAQPLGIIEGCDPSDAMREKAIERGIKALHGTAENLPYPTGSFDFALMVTTICFVNDAHKSISEVYRILKDKGKFIIAFVDKNSPVGKQYLKHKNESVFYKEATFYSTLDIYDLLWESDFKILKIVQTIFGELNAVEQIQHPVYSHGQGSFVVIKAEKQ
ncbi:MAG TPA: class I SAM-dependent methyltransferase [Ignavibacteria bacterium]|nr:class I SAM-dependent methyltransferase [Ignavibacteria bacterium]